MQCQSITTERSWYWYVLDDDDDDDDDDDELINYFCGMVDRRKGFRPYSQPRPFPEIPTKSSTNLRHPASRVWTCAEFVFRLVEWNYPVVITTTSTEIKSIMISLLVISWWTWWHYNKNLRKSKESKKIYENLLKLIDKMTFSNVELFLEKLAKILSKSYN